MKGEGQVFESLVATITKQHLQVRSGDLTHEFFRLFRQEVETFTEKLADEDEDGDSSEDLRDYVIERGRDEP